MRLNYTYPLFLEWILYQNGKMLGLVVWLICLQHNIKAGDHITFQIDAIIPEISLANPPCPTGHDTTLVICPYQSYTNNFLVTVDLPSNGIWEPPLHSPFQGEYNSCFDSASAYIFTTSFP